MSLPHPSPPKQVNLYARFLHDKYNFHLTLPSLTLGWKTGWTGPDFWNTELGHRGSFVLGYTGHDFSSVFYPRNCQRQLQPQQHWQKPFWAKKSHQTVLQTLLWEFLTSTKLTPHPPELPPQPYLGVNNEYNNSTICF